MFTTKEQETIKLFVEKKKEYLASIRKWNKSLAMLRVGVITPKSYKLLVSMANYITSEIGLAKLIENAEQRSKDEQKGK